MRINDIELLVKKYYESDRGHGRLASGILTFGIFGATKGIKALNDFIEVVNNRIKSSKNNNGTLSSDELQHLKNILQERWLRIRDGENSYLLNFEKATNGIYKEIALMLANELDEKPCILLMPSIKNSITPVLWQEFDLLKLNQYIITDDYQFLLPVDELVNSYCHTYQFKNHYNNKPFTENEMKRIMERIHSDPELLETFMETWQVREQLLNNISLDVIDPLKECIDAMIKDYSINPPEIRLGVLFEYIEHLPDEEKEILLNANIKEKSFAKVLDELRPQDGYDIKCSHTVCRNYLIPFLHEIERHAGKPESLSEFAEKIVWEIPRLNSRKSQLNNI